MSEHTVLIVDDSSIDLEIISLVCEVLGCDVDLVSDGNEAVERYDPTRHDLVLCDYVMEPVDGIYVVSQILNLNPKAKCVMVTGFPDAKLRTFAQTNQLHDLIIKPIHPQALKESLRIALSMGQNATAELDGVALSNRMDGCARLSGDDPETLGLRNALAAQINSRDVLVLSGPKGSGRAEVASFMHRNGPNAGGGFVTLDCKKYSEEELRSYLIDEAGNPGIQVKRANEGMLLLTNLPALPRDFQELLAAHLDRLTACVRIIILADVPLEAALEQGALDDELYFKIASNTIELG